MTVLVHVVVGEFDLLERDYLFAKLFTGKRRIRVHVESGRSWWVCLASYQPTASVIGVSVTFLVHWNDVH